jgi:hypothetical protein
MEALQFIDVLLGDEPAFESHERFYQRLLAGDDTEAANMAESQLKKQRLSACYDAVAMPALALAQPMPHMASSRTTNSYKAEDWRAAVGADLVRLM